MEHPHVTVAVCLGELEAQQLRAFLEANGIPVTFRGEALRVTHGLTLDGLGQVEIQVPAEREEEARTLLDAVERGELRIDDNDGGEPTE